MVGPKSDFPWEEDVLQHIRDQMPDAEPYRAWHTFTFTARTGMSVSLTCSLPRRAPVPGGDQEPSRPCHQQRIHVADAR